MAKEVKKNEPSIPELIDNLGNQFREVARQKTTKYLGERVEGVNSKSWDLFCAGVVCGLYEAATALVLNNKSGENE